MEDKDFFRIKCSCGTNVDDSSLAGAILAFSSHVEKVGIAPTVVPKIFKVRREISYKEVEERFPG